jgi:probable F420-dependent oxidoreductase
MDIGYFGFNNGPLGTPDAMRRILGALEGCGFESAWTGEHVVAIDPQEPPSPIPPEFPMLDTVAALSFAAGVTEKLKLGSGIILLAQRNPLVLAKELSSVDVLSKGRLLFGVGVGYVKGEFDAIGVPFDERGPRTSEHIEAIRTLWTSDKPSFDGQFSSFEGIQSSPGPVQRPHPPIIVGGMSAPAYRRAINHGNGWYGFNQTVEAAAESIAGLTEAANSTDRRAELGDLSISVTPRGAIDADSVKRFEDLGIDRLVLLPRPAATTADSAPEDGIVRFIEETATALALG